MPAAGSKVYLKRSVLVRGAISVVGRLNLGSFTAREQRAFPSPTFKLASKRTFCLMSECRLNRAYE